MAGLKTRKIRERWIIAGELELLTPASLSNGDSDPTVDLPILTDPLEGRALLTGASLAGALRSYLEGFSTGEGKAAKALFGGKREDADGEQSRLIVEDAIGPIPQVELRDGVSIDPVTRTALDRAKYDRELLAAGTRFPIAFELLIGEEDGDLPAAALVQALSSLERGEIRLGGRKRRGLGECKVTGWRAWRYDLTTPEGLRSWLCHGREGDTWQAEKQAPWEGREIRDWPPLDGAPSLTDQRRRFAVDGRFAIDGSVLIRAGFEADEAPDTTHLRSRRNNGEAPVLSGTSLGGVIRAQALRIARTISRRQESADELVDDLFGYYVATSDQEHTVRAASRVLVSESEVTGDYHDLVQSRVKIDRFTGGAYESALFAEQPVFGGEARLRWELENPEEAEIGLLILVLKDLWTGHVAVGGEASVGRGRLKGLEATLSYQALGGKQQWILRRSSADNGLEISGDDPGVLNDYVTAFVAAVGGDRS